MLKWYRLRWHLLLALRWPSRDGLHSCGLRRYHNLLQPDGDVEGRQASGRAHGRRRRERTTSPRCRQEPGLRRLGHAQDRPAHKHWGAALHLAPDAACRFWAVCLPTGFTFLCLRCHLSFQPRQNLLQAAGNVGQASGELLSHIGETDTDPQFQVCVILCLSPSA